MRVIIILLRLLPVCALAFIHRRTVGLHFIDKGDLTGLTILSLPVELTLLCEPVGSSSLDASHHKVLTVGLPGTASSETSDLVTFRISKTPLAACGPAIICTGLKPLDSDVIDETWRCPGTVTARKEGDISVVRSDRYLVVHARCKIDKDENTATATEDLYRQLMACTESHGYPYQLRTWNFIPDINCGEGKQERYQQFCLGRGKVLDARGLESEQWPAATCVGIDRDLEMVVVILASVEPGTHLENPRQVSAYEYPPEYGPRSPSFARATVVTLPDNGSIMLTSGTASIKGHQSMHEDNMLAQLDETITNLCSMNMAANGRTPFIPRSFGSESVFRIYLRQPDYLASARQFFRRAIGNDSAATFIQADICRRELAVEIEVARAV